MADLQHEREVARLEQERLERLKAEELMFQQVRQVREPEATELAVSASLWCSPLAERLPTAGYFHMVFLYLHRCACVVFAGEAAARQEGTQRAGSHGSQGERVSVSPLCSTTCRLVEWDRTSKCSLKATSGTVVGAVWVEWI